MSSTVRKQIILLCLHGAYVLTEKPPKHKANGIENKEFFVAAHSGGRGNGTETGRPSGKSYGRRDVC